MADMKYKDVSEVARAGLCTGCGTCTAVCPAEALEMVIDRKKGIYLPRLDVRKCTGCGTCVRVCPGHEVDFDGLNREIFGKLPEDAMLGNFTGCYTGHAVDENIRYQAASGGMVSALLIYALETGMINGALVTRMHRERPLEPEPFIARTREEILEAARSKYCPVPANVALKEILRAPEGERFAVVGLPCHVHGLRKAERVNKRLKEKIVLRLGLFCWHTDSFNMTTYQLRKFSVKENDVKSIDYRGNGWPGYMTINAINRENKSIPFEKSMEMHSNYFFTPVRCEMCLELTAELADISCGDAWIPEKVQRDSKGTSLIISRTIQGKNVLEDAQKDKHINVVPIREEVVRGLESVKKTDYRARAWFSRLTGPKAPDYNATIPSSKISSWIRYGFMHINARISVREQTRWLIPAFLVITKAMSRARKLL